MLGEWILRFRFWSLVAAACVAYALGYMLASVVVGGGGGTMSRRFVCGNGGEEGRVSKDIQRAVSTMEMLFMSQTSDMIASKEARRLKAEAEIKVEEPRLIVVNKDSLVDVAVSNLNFDTTVHHSGQSADTLEACPSSTSPDDIRLLIAVTSTCCTTRAMQNRNAIRRTWMLDGLLEHSDVVSIKFMLSTPSIDVEGDDALSSSSSSSSSTAAEVRSLLHRELSAAGANDIVMFGYALESYENLSLKTIGINRYMTLSNCGFTHLLKTDDDVYVRVPGALSMLGYQHTRWSRPENIFAGREEEARFTGLYIGKTSGGYMPTDDTSSKWYLPPDEWPKSVGLFPYNVGWGYIMSADLCIFVVERMDHYESVFATLHRDGGNDTSRNITLKNTDDDLYLPPNYRGMLKVEDAMMGCLLAEIGVSPFVADLDMPYYSSAAQLKFMLRWQYKDKFCPPLTVFKHLDKDALYLFPVLSVNDRTGLWSQKPIQCAVTNASRDKQASLAPTSSSELQSKETIYELYRYPLPEHEDDINNRVL